MIKEQDFLQAMVLQMVRRRYNSMTAARTLKGLGFSSEAIVAANDSLQQLMMGKRGTDLPTALEWLKQFKPSLSEDTLCEAIYYQALKATWCPNDIIEFLDRLRLDETSIQHTITNFPSAVEILGE